MGASRAPLEGLLPLLLFRHPYARHNNGNNRRDWAIAAQIQETEGSA
jgi:hypothetical protein